MRIARRFLNFLHGLTPWERRRVARNKQRLTGDGPKCWLSVMDETSGATVYWNPFRGHFDVHPFWFPSAMAEVEVVNARRRYVCPCRVHVHYQRED